MSEKKVNGIRSLLRSVFIFETIRQSGVPNQKPEGVPYPESVTGKLLVPINRLGNIEIEVEGRVEGKIRTWIIKV